MFFRPLKSAYGLLRASSYTPLNDLLDHSLASLDLILLRWSTEYKAGLLAKSILKALAVGDEILQLQIFKLGAPTRFSAVSLTVSVTLCS